MLDLGIVAEYAELMKAGSQFPPITVFHDGGNYWLADGYHRLEAADEARLEEIHAVVREGSRRDATLFACGANRDHGLRRTRADVRRAITTLVTDDEWKSWANRAIADMVGCSPTTVGTIRDQLSKLDNSNLDQDAQEPEVQVSKFDTWNDQPPDIDEMGDDDLSGMHQTAAMMKSEAPPSAPKTSSTPLKRTGRDGKSYPTTKAKPALKPTLKHVPAVNKARLAMQAAHGVAAALTALEPMEADLLCQDAGTVMANLRAALARLGLRFGGEVQGHA